MMKFFLSALLTIGIGSLSAQIVVEKDSTGLFVFKQTTEQFGGGLMTLQSAAMDSTTARNLLYNEILSAYDVLAQKKQEYLDAERRVEALRVLYAGFDPAGYQKRVQGQYSASIAGTYTYSESKKKKEFEIRPNMTIRPGNGTVQIIGPSYILIKNHFSPDSGKTLIDVAFVKRGEYWIGEIDGKKVKLFKK